MLTKKTISKGLFIGNDDDNKKDYYSVTKLIEMMSGKKIEEMRDLGLIPDLKMNQTVVFTEPLQFSDQIKRNVFESDYGLFCDYYMTRQLMINNKQKIKDMNVEKILLRINLTDDVKKLYNKYDLKSYFSEKRFPIRIEDHDQENVDNLITKIIKKMDQAKIDNNGITDIMKNGISEFFYPPFFMSKLGDQYRLYKDSTVKIDATKSTDPIYYVSLCAKFNDDRRRLVYRNVQEIYAENNQDVLPRIDQYVDLIKHNQIICKLRMNKLYKFNKDNVMLGGELDYVDMTNNTLCDIKCSEGDFKVEWLIQLLIYYALFKCNPDCCQEHDDPDLYDKINIQNIAIINIFTGKYYDAQIPENYDWELLLDYIGSLLKDDLRGCREKHQVHEPLNDLNLMIPQHNDDENNQHDNHVLPNDDSEIHYLDQSTCGNKKGYMVLDVENNCVNTDIIQLAYILYNDNHTEIKRVNKYVKDRFVDWRAGEITGITTDMLRKKGTAFNQIIKEFLTDLHGVHTMCGHNVCTDISKIKSNMIKFKIQPNYDVFQFIVVDDTVNMYRSIGGKNIKLGDLYQSLFNQPMENAHDALIDVTHTAKCYVELKKMIYLHENPDAYCDENSEDIKVYKKSLFLKNTNSSPDVPVPIPEKSMKYPKIPKLPKKYLNDGLSDILNNNFFS